MLVDQRLEQLYQRIELVKGMGDPRRGRLCVMSFVALLAGEGHSDSPGVASPLIRRFAIPINDRMPEAFRQRLKLFAPRIIGTRDRLDDLRAELLVHAVREEIVPRMRVDFAAAGFVPPWPSGAGRARAAAAALVARCRILTDAPATMAGPMAEIEIASATAHLLAHCAGALARQEAAWYWNEAIDLLDRLCDISDERAEPRIDWARVAWLEDILERRARMPRHKAMAIRTLDRLRRILPLWADAGVI
jgi:hypothetical protein